MNACYVLLEFPVLSQTFVTDEIDAVRERGHQVMTVSLQGGAGADVALGTRRARDPWTLWRVARLLWARPSAARALVSGPLTLGLRLKLLAAGEEARRRRVDTVHAHFAYRNADGAELIGWALGTGHSVTVHAQDIFVGDGRLVPRLDAARTVVTVCDYNVAHLEQRLPGVAAKTVVVPCSTRVDAEPVTDRHRAGCRPVVLAVGRLVEKKGFDDLVAAVALARTDFDVAVVGDGPLAPTLAKAAAEAGVADRVRFLGPLDHRATLERFAGADLFCLPTKVAADGDRDSMPVVVKEAMAAGLAVVSTREVGVPEMVEDGVTGVLVAPGDRVALAAALDRLVADPALRRRMGQAGRRAVTEKFDIRRQAEALEEALA